MSIVWIFVTIKLLITAGGVYAGEQCTDPRAESEKRYCEYGCCNDASSGQGCCGFPIWTLAVGIIGGFLFILIVIIAACCIAHKIQTKKMKKSVRPADRVVIVSRPAVRSIPARYSSTEMTSEYSYCAHELYEQPQFRQTFWTPDNLQLYTSDTESYYGNPKLNTTDEIKSARTIKSGLD